ncbi:MAG TPA: PqqD family protein [Desulfobacterales bacterium]|nr:PqqD family protein [Desulfobacterales bacterium]
MTLSDTTKVSVSDHTLTQNVRGETVMLNLDSECYFGLDKVGTRMWTVLCETESIQKAYETLKDRYDVAADVLRSDLVDFVEKMAGHGLLELHDK